MKAPWVCLAVFLSLLTSNAWAGIVFSLDPASPTAGVTAVFRPGPAGIISNAALGLSDLDNLNALSYGRDRISGALWFSVDRVSVGAPGSDVNSEAAPGEAAADIFQSLPPDGSNVLTHEEVSLGLLPGFFGDDIDALAREENAAHLYFSIDLFSGSNTANQANDIFIDHFSTVFASGEADMGLDPFDDLDALVLWDVINPGVLDPGIDKALFSLSVFSASVGTYSSADIFLTDFTGSFSTYATADELGLEFFDDLDGLQTAVPEPSSLALMISCLAVASASRLKPRRWRSRQQ